MDMISQTEINNEVYLFLRSKRGSLVWTLKMSHTGIWYKCRGKSSVHTFWIRITQTEANILGDKYK